jgi:hypothetical protein
MAMAKALPISSVMHVPLGGALFLASKPCRQIRLRGCGKPYTRKLPPLSKYLQNRTK